MLSLLAPSLWRLTVDTSQMAPLGLWWALRTSMSSTLETLEDVEVATAEDGEALIYNQTENTWTAAPAPVGPPGTVWP